MKNTAIIIPTRLGALRFPNKPLAKINNIPMIIHVVNRAKESRVGEVFVATPDEEIFNIVKELNEKEGVSILLAEQNTNVALRNADYGYIIETGHVMLHGSADELLNDEKVKELYLGISKEGRKNFRDVLREEETKKLA